MKTLSTLRRERAALVNELDKLNAAEPRMVEEREKLLDGLDMEAAPSAAFTELAIRLEALPRRRVQLETKLEALDKELRPAIEVAVLKIIRVASVEGAELRSKVFATLRKFAPKLREEDSIINEVVHLAEAYTTRIAHLDTSTSYWTQFTAEEAANRVSALAAQHGLDLDKLPEVPAWQPPAVADEPATKSTGEIQADQTEVGAT